MAKFTEDELAMLTEDERRVLEELGEEYDEDNDQPPMDPDDDPEEFEGAEEQEEEAEEEAAEEESEEAEVEEPEEEGGEEEAAEEAEESAKEPPAKEEAAEEEPPKQEPAAPLVEMPENLDERLQAFKTDREKLDGDFDDGELTAQEYREKLAEIETQERELRIQAAKAEASQEFYAQQQKQTWQQDVTDFLSANEIYGKSEFLYDALNNAVIRLANSEEAAGLSGRQILAKAHEKVAGDPALAPIFNQAKPGKEEGGDKKQGDEEVEKPKGKQAKRRNVPPTLSKVPAADMTDAQEGGPFAKLDKLDGLDLEAELSRLSNTNPKLVEDYLSR